MKPVLLFACVVAPLLAIQPDEGARILQRVDALRNPFDHFSLDLELASYHKDQAEVWRFRVYGQGKDKSLVEFLSPASEQGKYLLMLRDGMWIYVPSTSRPIRISPLQRLMGEASNGDVARTNYSADYTAESIAPDTVDGKPAYRLDLAANDSQLSYSRVVLWVTRSGDEPVKADYYVGSGKLVKRVFFREIGSLGGSRMVTKVEIFDAVRPDRRTVMSYTRLEEKHLPAKMFQPTYLGKW